MGYAAEEMEDKAITAHVELPENIVSSLILHGDLSKLNPTDKVKYYHAYCSRIGLDPVTQPFKILNLKGKEVLYCDRSGTQQLNKLHSVSHRIVAREQINGCYVVIAQAFLTSGRQTESIGAVGIEGLKGDNLCNALMKAETKAKRRSTLDLLGLGILDETEIETIPNAKTLPVISNFDSISAKLNEAKSLPHLQNIWKKHYAEITKLDSDDVDLLTTLKNNLKDRLKADFKENQEKQVQKQPEPEYLITQDQIDRIKDIVKHGGSGRCLTELERQKIADFANNQNALKADVEKYIESTLMIISQREAETAEGD